MVGLCRADRYELTVSMASIGVVSVFSLPKFIPIKLFNWLELLIKAAVDLLTLNFRTVFPALSAISSRCCSVASTSIVARVAVLQTTLSFGSHFFVIPWDRGVDQTIPPSVFVL